MIKKVGKISAITGFPSQTDVDSRWIGREESSGGNWIFGAPLSRRQQWDRVGSIKKKKKKKDTSVERGYVAESTRTWSSEEKTIPLRRLHLGGREPGPESRRRHNRFPRCSPAFSEKIEPVCKTKKALPTKKGGGGGGPRDAPPRSFSIPLPRIAAKTHGNRSDSKRPGIRCASNEKASNVAKILTSSSSSFLSFSLRVCLLKRE